MKRALLTGGTGFVGLNLAQALLADGWEVTAVHRPSSDLRWIRRFPVTLAEAALDDRAALHAAMPERVDAVFHVAGNTNLWSRLNDRQYRDNVVGTRNVVEVAIERRARRFIHTSSIAAYGVHREPVREDSPKLGKRSWVNYLRTKALAEDEVLAGVAAGLDAVILNPSNIIGPFDLRSWSTMIYLVDAGRLPGAPPGRGSFCHVHEVVRAHIAAVEHGRTGSNYLLGGTDASYLDVIRIIGELTGRRVPDRATSPWLLRLAARGAVLAYPFTRRRPQLTPETAHLVSQAMCCVSELAERELGYRPRPLREMLADCHAWMAAEGRLESRRRQPAADP